MFWFCLSLTFAAIYSVLALQQAFSAEYVVQDDARQHVFWMQRFLTPDLFPNDLIADYFQSVAPVGYTTVYRAAAMLGLDPLYVHKVLPVGLHLITAALCFGVSLVIFPVPAAAFSSTILLAQGLGLTDAIVSGTPKAFIYPLFLAFMYYLLQKKLLPCLGTIALQGVFYPQLVFISAGVLTLRLFRWQRWMPILTPSRGDRQLVMAGLVVAVVVMLPYALQTSEFGPVISVAEARDLPEFSLPGSRSRYFYDDDPATFWLKGRSGLRFASALTPVTNGLGLVLPALLAFPKTFSLIQRLSRGIFLLPQLLVSSLVMFGAAHILLFRLHLPSRYTQHSFRIVLSLAAGIVLVTLIHAVWKWTRTLSTFPFHVPSHILILLKRGIALSVTLLLGLPLVFYPSLVDTFPITAYQIGRSPDLYEYVRSQPVDTRIASLSEEANNLPTFTERSILVGSEYAIPYHIGYYQQFRQRATDLIRAQYSPDSQDLKEFIHTYKITLWLLDRGAFKPSYINNQAFIQQYPDAAENAQLSLQKETPALLTVVKSCTILKPKGLILLDAQCVADRL
ncbi:MAG: hypothetical protein ACFE0I_14040 [Elainellaceae cyanobacterium]